MNYIPPITPVDSYQVTTLNMLHDTFLQSERADRVAERMKYFNSEIFCGQEVVFEDGTTSVVAQKIADAAGLKVVGKNIEYYDRYDRYSGTIIMSPWPVLESGRTFKPETSTGEDIHKYDGCYAVLQSPTNQVVIVFSVHGNWGGHNEYIRETQFLLIDQQAANLEAKYQAQGCETTTILCGDFNSEPDSSTMRFLLGKNSLRDRGTYWTDAWSVRCDPKSEGYTFIPSNKLVGHTALAQGIHFPELMPHRRIDYILVRGWVYGKKGTPFNTHVVFDETDGEGYTVSDHLGVRTQIWNPR